MRRMVVYHHYEDVDKADILPHPKTIVYLSLIKTSVIQEKPLTKCATLSQFHVSHISLKSEYHLRSSQMRWFSKGYATKGYYFKAIYYCFSAFLNISNN